MREKEAKTRAMIDGIRFEELVNAIVSGEPLEEANEKWYEAARRFAKLCEDGQKQVPVSGRLTAMRTGDLPF